MLNITTDIQIHVRLEASWDSFPRKSDGGAVGIVVEYTAALKPQTQM